MFRTYEVDFVFNGKRLTEAWIDPHYEVKHSPSISDQLILDLLRKISGISMPITNESKGFYYFKIDIKYREKPFRLILVVPENYSYIGVRNVYRRSK